MKIGIDIHGVLDTYTDKFAQLTEAWVKEGYQIHIITGEPEETAKRPLLDANIRFHYFFSIVDYHILNKTPSLRLDDKGHYWVDRNVWLATKGDYARRQSLDLHFDDQIEYAEYFPKDCTFIYVPTINFDKILDILT